LLRVFLFFLIAITILMVNYQSARLVNEFLNVF
jgi:hypothetical protein